MELITIIITVTANTSMFDTLELIITSKLHKSRLPLELSYYTLANATVMAELVWSQQAVALHLQTIALSNSKRLK